MKSSTEKESRSYGKRICLVCRGNFTAMYAAQLTCCEKCQRERKNILNAISAKARRMEHRELRKEVVKLQAKIEQLRKENQELQKRLELAGVSV